MAVCELRRAAHSLSRRRRPGVEGVEEALHEVRQHEEEGEAHALASMKKRRQKASGEEGHGDEEKTGIGKSSARNLDQLALHRSHPTWVYDGTGTAPPFVVCGPSRAGVKRPIPLTA